MKLFFKYIFLPTVLFSLNVNLFCQPVVNDIKINGNTYFAYSELVSVLVTKKDKPFNSAQFDADIKAIREKYRQSGFLLIKIINTDKIYSNDSTVLDIKINIEEGLQVKIGELNITGNTIYTKEELFRVMETKTDEILDNNKLNNDIKEILSLYEKKGMPFTKIVVEEINIYYENSIPKLKISLNVAEGKFTTIEEIKIKGNETTNDNVIIREISLKKGNLVTLDKLNEIKFRLDRLNIFEKVEEPKLYTIKGTNKLGLIIEVKEGNNNSFDGVIGYVPPPSENEDGYFTGLVNISFRNIFGTGRKIEARWQQERKSVQELEFKYTEPYILSFPVNLNFGFMQRIQDTAYTQRKFEFKGDVLLSYNFVGSLSIGADRVIPATDSNRTPITSDYSILYTGIELRYDTRDNIYNPSGGAIYKATYMYGDKKISDLNIFHYVIQRYSGQLDLFFSFFKRQNSLLKIFWGEVVSEYLETADLIKIGGNKNIRGYRDEQFLASRLAYGTIEPRYSLSRKSYLFGFFDFGYYFRDEDLKNKIPKQEGFLYGYGLGLQIETGIGIIGVHYAIGKGNGILDGNIYFGLINNF